MQESKVEQKETGNKELNIPRKSTRDKKGPVDSQNQKVIIFL